MGETKKLLSSGLIIFVGSMIASVFSYLFNMLMGRMLGPVQYGEMTAISSLLSIVAIGGGVILTVSMRYSGEAYGLGSFSALRKMFKIFSKYVLFIGLIFFFFGVALLRPISSFFQIEHSTPLILAFAGFITGFLVLVNRGILQGTQRFAAISVVGVLEMGLRLILGIILVRLGLEVRGAILGMVLATAFAYLFTFLPIRQVLRKRQTEEEKDFSFNKKEIIAYALPTTLATILLVISMNIDIIFIKHYFPARDAGLYAAISTIAKIILYGTAPIISVMFPLVSEKMAKGEKHYKLFIYSILITLVGALVALSLYVIAPSKVIALLYGTHYTSLYYLLPEVGLFIVFYTLINLVANYFLAVKNFTFLWFYASVLVGQIILVALWHPSMTMVVRSLIATTGLLFALMMGYYLFTKREQLLKYFKGEYGEETQAVDSDSSV